MLRDRASGRGGRSRALSAGQTGLLALHWLMLTIALGAAVIYSDESLEGLVSPRIDGSTVFLAAFALALLLGIPVASARLLAPLVVAQCLVAALIYAAVVLSPTLAGTAERSRWLENFLTVRVFVLTLMMLLPATFGATVGTILGTTLQDRREARAEQSARGDQPNPWWERPAATPSSGEAVEPERLQREG